MQADPVDALDIAQLCEEFAQVALLVDVESIVGEVLCDQDQLLHPFRCQTFCVGHQLFRGRAHVFATHERYGAEGALTVAALTDLEVREVGRCGEQPLPHQFVLVVGLQCLQQPREVTRTEPCIHLWDLGHQLRRVALAEAAGHVHLLHQTLVLRLGVAEDSVDALLLGIVDEAAGIDHHHVVLTAVALMVHGDPVGLQLGHQHFAVEGVLGAPESDHVHLSGFEGTCFHAFVGSPSPSGPRRMKAAKEGEPDLL